MMKDQNSSMIKKLADLCHAAGVFGFCQDEKGTLLTPLSGNEREVEKLQELIDMKQCSDACHRIHTSEYEDLLMEETSVPWIRIGVVDVKQDGISANVTWCFIAVLSDLYRGESVEETGFTTYTDSGRFNAFLDCLTEFTRTQAQAGAIREKQGDEMVGAFQEAKLGMTVKRLGATTELVQLLDREEPIEKIMSTCLEIVSGFLDISRACIYRYRGNDKEPEIIAKWNGIPGETPLDAGYSYETFASLSGKPEKPVVISYATTLPSEEREALENNSVYALAVIPISINGQANMYAGFYETEKERNWEIEEIRYMNDAVRILQSIITRRVQSNSLAGSYRTLESILDNVGCGVFVWSPEEKKILFANRFVRATFSRELKDGELMDIFGEKLVPSLDEGNYELHYFGRDTWYDFYYTRISWMDSKNVLLCSMYDITDKKVYQQKIEQQAYTDFLTGLYNRMCCERDLAKFIDTAKNEKTQGALLYLDLDDFKHINDGLGHQYGDMLLQSISHSIQHVAGITDSCYRMGGDEFVIIIPPEAYGNVSDIIDKIKAIFAKPWFLKGADYYCTMSMGIVTFPDDGDKVDDLIKKADVSMYQAKKSGKNRVARYSDSADIGSGKRLDMEKNMREAASLGCDEFEVYYQPIMEVTGKEPVCVGAEALIRWNSAEMGFVAPGEFIPLAEYLGLITPIGAHVLEKACSDCKRWNDNGYPRHHVNVNLSVVQLLQPEIEETISKVLDRTNLDPKNLTVEVTESLAVNDMRRMKEVLGHIREMGCKIALDDFGTGYSSLSHIREMPLDIIKVDQSFVKDLAEGTYPQAFIRMITELAKVLNTKVCVEGIENEEQYNALTGLGVAYIQGFYFDKPLKRTVFIDKYINKKGAKK